MNHSDYYNEEPVEFWSFDDEGNPIYESYQDYEDEEYEDVDWEAMYPPETTKLLWRVRAWITGLVSKIRYRIDRKYREKLDEIPF